MNPTLLPQPKSLARRDGEFSVPVSGVIGIGDSSLYPIAAGLQALFPGLAVNASYPGSRDAISVSCQAGLKRDAYRLVISTDGIRIEAGAEAGAFYAVQTLRQLLAQATGGALPALEIEDVPDFEDRGVYYDVTRGRVPNLEQLLRMADQLSRFKINQLQLYIEHTFLFRGHPDIGKDASPLSAEDILKLDAHCRARHIELVPSLASFGHLSTVLKHPQYHALAEDWGVGKFVDPDAPPGWGLNGWTLSPANPDIYVFLDSLFAEFLPLFSSKRFNACCDETYDLGWGQSYELCKQRGKGRVYLDHIAKVSGLAKKYGKSLMFWGDIIRHHPDLVTDIPKDVTVLDWGYNHNHNFEAIRDFQQAGLKFYACPGTGSWSGLFPRLPEACANIAGFAAAGKKFGAQGLLNTDWGDGGHYNFMEYSWHGYVFGAEQGWNTGADRKSFTKRFIEHFLGTPDPELASALDDLGDISFTGGSNLWQMMFFALPDDAIFRQTQPVGVTVVRNGQIALEKIRLDAAHARSLLVRLGKIRDVFAAREGKVGLDPEGVLPYWIFAVDTTAMAVRKLAAFGPGAKPDADEKAAIKQEMRELRRRFKTLWLARNRPSEIGITLARYDRLIRGDCVRTTLAEGEGGLIRLTVANTGDRDASGQITLKVTPETKAAFGSPAKLRFTKLQPGCSRTAEFRLNVSDNPGKLIIEASGNGPGVHGTSLMIYGEREWTIPMSAGMTSGVVEWLKTMPPRQVSASSQSVAEVRSAIAGDSLAVLVSVADAAIRRGNPVWSESCVEVFGSAIEAGSPIGQVFLAPPTADEAAAAFKLDGIIVPAPEIQLISADLLPEGYALGALIPLSLLQIPSGAKSFRLEMVVTARWQGRSEHRRAALFYAVSDAAVNNAGFGIVKVSFA